MREPSWWKRQALVVLIVEAGLILVILQGSLCQFDLSTTCGSHLQCQNNGTCVYSANNTLSSEDTFGTCVCLTGFAGFHCDIETVNCSIRGNACLNGECVSDNRTLAEYCQCVPGFSGKFCEIDIDDCASQPCHHGGVCLDKINGFACACPFGFTGRLCENNLTVCEENPCQNRGFCLEEEGNKKTCYCVPDFHGEFCEFQYNECEPEPQCHNGGTCIDGVGEFTCSCPPDYFGPICQCSFTNTTTTSQYCQELLDNITSTSTAWISSPAPSTETLVTMLPTIITSEMVEIPITTSIPVTTEDIIVVTSTAFPDEEEYSTTSFIMSETELVSATSTPFVPISSESLVLSTEMLTDTFIGPEMTTTMIISSEVELTTELLTTVIVVEPTLVETITTIETEEHPFTTLYPNSSETIELPYTSTVIEIEPTATTTAVINISQIVTTVSEEYETSILTTSLPEETVSVITETETFPMSTSTPTFGETEQPFPTTIGPSDTVYASESEIPVTTIVQISTTPIFEVPSSEVISSVIHEDTESMLSTVIESTESLPPASPSPTDSEYPITETLIITVTSEMTEIVVVPSPTESEPVMPSSEVVTTTEGPTTTTAASAIPTTEPVENITASSSTTTETNLNACESYCLNNAKCSYSNNVTKLPICHCPFKYSGLRCENLKEKISIPSFQGNSYLLYNLTSEQNKMIDTSITLASLVPDSLVLYTGVLEGLTYILIFIKNGHVVLHFSCGEQSMSFIETRTRVDTGYNFTLDLNMEMLLSENHEFHCSCRLTVNESYTMSGEQIVGKGNFAFKPTFEQMYLGGIEPDMKSCQNLRDDVIGSLDGFRGCFYQLLVNKVEHDMYDLAIDGANIGECKDFVCTVNPCFGLAKCLPSHQFPLWQCICPPQFEGVRCQIPVCTQNPCLNGGSCSTNVSLEPSRGELSVDPALHCNCNLGFRGPNCEIPVNITQPSFHSIPNYSSFISYIPLPSFKDWFQLKFHFVTTNMTQYALVLFLGGRNPHYYSYGYSSTEQDVAPTLSTQIESPTPGYTNNETLLNEIGEEPDESENSLDFFAITFLQGYVALTWNLGSGVQRISTPYRIDTRLSVHTLYTGRSGRTSWLKVDGMMNISGTSPGKYKALDTNMNELFIGGYETFRMEGLPYDLSLHDGFVGCVFDLGFRVRNKLFLPDIKRGRNVGNCFVDYYGG